MNKNTLQSADILNLIKSLDELKPVKSPRTRKEKAAQSERDKKINQFLNKANSGNVKETNDRKSTKRKREQNVSKDKSSGAKRQSKPKVKQDNRFEFAYNDVKSLNYITDAISIDIFGKVVNNRFPHNAGDVLMDSLVEPQYTKFSFPADLLFPTFLIEFEEERKEYRVARGPSVNLNRVRILTSFYSIKKKIVDVYKPRTKDEEVLDKFKSSQERIRLNPHKWTIPKRISDEYAKTYATLLRLEEFIQQREEQGHNYMSWVPTPGSVSDHKLAVDPNSFPFIYKSSTPFLKEKDFRRLIPEYYWELGKSSLTEGGKYKVNAVFIPKNYKSNRLIATGSTAYGVPLSFVRPLQKFLEENNNGLQFISQEVTREALYTKTMYDTIDQSEASNSVRNDNPRPEVWNMIIQAFHADNLLYKKEVVDVLAVGTLGQPTTFTDLGIHSYTCAVLGVADYEGVLAATVLKKINKCKEEGNYGSFFGTQLNGFPPIINFGDDTMCLSHYSVSIIRMLKLFGGTINMDKSHILETDYSDNHKYREACGKEAYNNRDVTRIYLRGLKLENLCSFSFNMEEELDLELPKLQEIIRYLGQVPADNDSKLDIKFRSSVVVPFSGAKEPRFGCYSKKHRGEKLITKFNSDYGIEETIISNKTSILSIKYATEIARSYYERSYRNEGISYIIEILCKNLNYPRATDISSYIKRNTIRDAVNRSIKRYGTAIKAGIREILYIESRMLAKNMSIDLVEPKYVREGYSSWRTVRIPVEKNLGDRDTVYKVSKITVTDILATNSSPVIRPNVTQSATVYSSYKEYKDVLRKKYSSELKRTN